MFGEWTEPEEKKDPRVIFFDLEGIDEIGIPREKWTAPQEEIDKFAAEFAGNEKFEDIPLETALEVRFGWSRHAMSFFYELTRKSSCYDNPAEIVFCSPWNGIKSVQKMKTLLSLHHYDVEKHLSAILTPEKGQSKIDAIKDYIEKREDLITRFDGLRKPQLDLRKYVILSTENMLENFPGHFIRIIDGVLTDKYVKSAGRIFSYGFWWDSERRIYRDYDIDDGFKNVIFLDIDGVLNNEDSQLDHGAYIIDEYVKNLAEIVNACDAEIVLTSSWRYGLTSWFSGGCKYDGWNAKAHKELLQAFSKYNLRVADMTPMLSVSGLEARPTEIRVWLAGRASVEHFVILDDDEWKWKWLEAAVVRTCELSYERLFPDSPTITEKYWRVKGKGLRSHHAVRAVEILQGKMPNIGQLTESGEAE